MHISEGVLSPPVLIGGAVLMVAGLAIGLKKTEADDVPTVGILSACFFVASLIHVPIGLASVHLVLNGLVGLVLGWMAFPAILVGLVLQAMLFQFGGLTGLGVNTVSMALPAVACYYLFRPGILSPRMPVFIVAAAGCGFLALLLSSLIVAFALYLTGEAFLPAAWLIVISNLPVMLIEGGITAACAVFLKKVKPELLGLSHQAAL